ncbi:sodium/proline symporter [Isoptericola sp. CG 20/1183]|uniref:Sodium/proline symporter n=1 Tax=Isoptericola halotolerans TaxID=300560 RepID=A0ABX5EI79_9MICO|nr:MULTISPECIES: sodium/proline symporter PutP [Isoptericola]PRZ08463.1 sodium/proline symporter [Isoptericola halotolerans]PRZ11090.1 sodium/proline symporter [Isoptericola sp. CG 20/1183]
MSDQTWTTIAIVAYLALMLGIGYAAFRRTNDLDDYMLGGRRLHPGVAALSAGASDMSGWLLMGLPGAIYLSGLVEAWIAIGLTIGAWLNWKFVAPRLRAYTEVSNNSITIPSFFENRLRDTSRLLRIAAGAIVLVFFTFYVSSGMVAGGTFFESSFDMSYTTGLLVVGGVTLAYTLFGGFLGATWTDVAQGLLMLLALVAVPIVAIVEMGGWDVVREGILAADTAAAADHLSFVAGASATGIISALAWGLGYFGQPHIIVRFMAMRSPADATVGRRIGISWMILTGIGAVLTGLIGVAYVNVNGLALENPETVFLFLAQTLFHPVVAGLVLAAVLAAIMSTISSQLIVSSSALVEDLVKMTTRRDLSARAQVMLGRAGVLTVAIVAGLIAMDRTTTILDLVGFAWAGFGAAFGPIVLLSLYWRRLTRWGALTGMVGGAVVAFAWGRSPLSDSLYEIVPGFVVGLVAAVVVSLLTARPGADVEEEFVEARRLATAPATPATV